jgi:CubicO group peptidase (beta-lactamase class C family)
MEASVRGWCDPAFAAVREAFVENFAVRGEVGAGVCVVVDGEAVVDLVGGWADLGHSKPWGADTICDFYSVGKALLGLLLLQLVDAGHVGLDDSIASAWPEFAAAGKEAATIRHALCHRAGVPAIRELLTNDDLFDWERMTGALAATEPWFTPGERHTYHTNTYGHLVGELIHRVGGVMPGEAMRTLTAPLGADVWFGVPTDEQHRCADVIWDPSQPIPTLEPADFVALTGDLALNALAHFNPPGYSSAGVMNTAPWRSAQIGSTSGHGSANGIARIYAALAEPDRLLSADLLAEATSSQSTGPCPVLGEDVTFGLGFTPTTHRRPFGPNPHSFGHFGTGGALGFADPDTGIGFGYVMNHVIPRWQSSRNRALIDALYASI